MIQKNWIFLVAFFVSILSSAQIKGVVLDSATRLSIPYVSIWVENGNNGTTSEENGKFELNVSEKSKTLLFSALGYEKKTVAISKEMQVELTPSTIELQEVVISKRFGNKQIEIGETDNSFLQAYENGPRLDIKFFPYQSKYKRTKFIKQVIINTDSRIEEAMLKLHFYKVDSDGLPGEEYLEKDFIVTVSKGVKKTLFNLNSFNLVMPKNGIFVGFERLKIERNKFEKTLIDSNTNSTIFQTSFCPFVLYNRVERDFSFTFSGGKWNKESSSNSSGTSSNATIYEPAINLILTN
jgi:hypothetical protein